MRVIIFCVLNIKVNRFCFLENINVLLLVFTVLGIIRVCIFKGII